MGKHAENTANAILTIITVVGALLMWRQDLGHAATAVASVAFSTGAAALLAHFIGGLDS